MRSFPALRGPAASHEDLFVSRYDTLLRVAVGLTRGDRASAEDLVHDAYVRFTFVRPELRDPARLDAYLGRMLHNLHLSRLRRGQRIVAQDLSLVEYDSAEIGLLTANPGAWTEARHTLRRLCEYGCVRRTTSKSGSVFLLRFFLGYVPSEIAAILHAPASSVVDSWLRLARQEARLFLDDPSRLRFAGTESPVPARPAAAAAVGAERRDASGAPEMSDLDLLAELRARIVATPHRRCFSQRTLTHLYRATPASGVIGTTRLAEIVGCASCLAQVSAILGLPSASDRDPMDTLGPQQRSGGPSRPAGGRGLALRSRRGRDLFEHQPKALRVFVNGFPIGEQAVGEGDTRFTIAVNPPEPMGLVEVVSEQDLCLLYLEVEPPPNAPAEQSAFVDLSDGRQLVLMVTFAETWPSVQLTYRRPATVALEPVDAALGDLVRRDVGFGDAAMDASLALDRRGVDSSAPDRSRVDRIREDVRARVSKLREWLTDLSRPPLFSTRGLAVMAVLGWLFFATPFVDVSAAQHVERAVRRAVTAIWEWWRGASRIGAEPPIPTRPIPLSLAPAFVATHALRAPAPVRRVTSEPVLIEIELQALARLQQVDAYLGQEVSLARDSNGVVRLTAIVDSESRRRALLDSLRPLHADALHLQVRNAGRTRPSPGGQRAVAVTAPLRDYSFAADDHVAAMRFRTYLLTRSARADASATAATGASPHRERDLQAEVNALAARGLSHSQRASQHAWAIDHVMTRFPPHAIALLPAETQATWTRLLQTHAARHLHEIQQIHDDVEPAFRRPRSTADARVAAPSATDVLRDAPRQRGLWARRLFELNAVQDEAFRALSVSSGARVAYVLDDEVFWRQVDELMHVARLLQLKGSTP